MDSLPIKPTNPTYDSQAGKEIPLRERVHNNLSSIRQTHTDLQIALAADNSPSHIDSLLQQMQAPIQDLLQITIKQPPLLSQNEIDVVKAISVQYQSMQTDPRSVSASTLAALQANSSTLEQMFEAEVAGVPEPHVSALQAQNHLSSLSEALHLNIEKCGIDSSASEAIIKSMKNPMAELAHLSESGVLTAAQSDVVIALTTAYTTTIQVPGMTTPQVIAQFQINLQSLNTLLIHR
jgi:hypothetical protein